MLGNGQSVGPLCSYFEARGYALTIAARNPEKTNRLAGGTLHPTVVKLDLTDASGLAALVAKHDLVASFVPGGCQLPVVQACLKTGVSLVVSCHAHYFNAFSGGVQALDEQAKARRIAVVSELGVDCGYLGMMAVAELDRLRASGSRIDSLVFHAGVIPGEYVNPFDYAFFWAAKKAALSYVAPKAGKADWIRGGDRIHVDRDSVYARPRMVDVPGAGALETHPNLDSGAYQYPPLYGLETIDHFYHGTLRHLGWCNALKAIVALGFYEQSPRPDLCGRPFADVTRELCQRPGNDVVAIAADKLGYNRYDDVMLRLEWLGLFGDTMTCAGPDASPAEMLAQLMLQKFGVHGYNSGVCSRVVSTFEVSASSSGGQQSVRSVFDTTDDGQGHSVATRLISETTAIVGRHIVDGELQNVVGYHHPYKRMFYTPVLREQASQGFRNRVWVDGSEQPPAW